MRKKALIFTAVAMAAIAVFVLTACNKKDDKSEKSNVSRSVSALYVGESDNYAVNVECGVKEKNFIADGVATDVVDFAELVFIPLTAHTFTEAEFSVVGGTTTLSGILTADEFGEFRAAIDLDFAPESVTLKIGDKSETVDLQNVLQDKLTASDVINIAQTEFSDRIAAETAEDGSLNREIYVKLISGDRENYYYYVSFIGDGVDYWAMLVDPATGAVISKK